MQCKCGYDDRMKLIAVHDTGSSSLPWHDGEDRSIAFNVYFCGECGRICREMIWDLEGIIWLEDGDK